MYFLLYNFVSGLLVIVSGLLLIGYVANSTDLMCSLCMVFLLMVVNWIDRVQLKMLLQKLVWVCPKRVHE